jgi:hypothetical protein
MGGSAPTQRGRTPGLFSPRIAAAARMWSRATQPHKFWHATVGKVAEFILLRLRLEFWCHRAAASPFWGRHRSALERTCWLDLPSLLKSALEHPIKEIAVAVCGIVLWIVARLIWRRILIFCHFFASRTRALRAVARERTKNGPREGSGLWLRRPIHQPDNYLNSFLTRVLVLANNKGRRW